MNLQQIIDEINKDIDDTLETGVLTGWINRALDIASTVDKYEQRIALLFEDGVSDYALPSDFVELVYVIGANGEYNQIQLFDFDSVGYKRWGDMIGFQNVTDNVVDLYYYARYPHLENPEDEPVLPLQFQDLLVLYAVARARYQDEEESLENNAMGEFNRRLVEFRNFIGDRRKKQNVRIKTIW